jgi:hypothetical protein
MSRLQLLKSCFNVLHITFYKEAPGDHIMTVKSLHLFWRTCHHKTPFLRYGLICITQSWKSLMHQAVERNRKTKNRISSGMGQGISDWMVPYILKNHVTFIIKDKLSMGMKATRTLGTLVTTHPMTQHHIPATSPRGLLMSQNSVLYVSLAFRLQPCYIFNIFQHFRVYYSHHFHH